MKITRTASNKIKLSYSDWIGLGINAGWIDKKAYESYSGPTSGTTVKTIELYKDDEDNVSVVEDVGNPFMADVYYRYIPSEKSEFDQSNITYPGSDASIEILSIKDSETGELIRIDYALVEEQFGPELIQNYEQESKMGYEQSMEGQLERKEVGL